MLNKGGFAASIAKHTSRPTSYDFVPEWQDKAACIGYDPDLWFPEWPKPNEYRQARRICSGCPVRSECLQFALESDNRYGMFGGLTPGERESIKMRHPLPIPA